jgi:hypothetical protein
MLANKGFFVNIKLKTSSFLLVPLTWSGTYWSEYLRGKIKKIQMTKNVIVRDGRETWNKNLVTLFL